MMGWKKGSAVRAVYKCDKKTMRIVEKYPSASEAARRNKLNPTSLGHAARTLSVTPGPYVWRYAEDYDPNEKFEGKHNRPVAVYDSITRTLAVFNRIEDAARAVGTRDSYIITAMKNQTMYKSRYVFKYAR